MAYVAVVKAQFDYTAQDPETELSFSEDQILYVVEKEDDDWWKAKPKSDGDDEPPVGLVPATYVEEIPPISTSRALYAYTSTSPEELSMEEDQVLHVFSVEEDWLLVRLEDGPETLGFVPRNYCEQPDESEGARVEDASEAAEVLEAQRLADEEAGRQREMQRQLKLKDKVETWGISEMDGRKKKKGTLGVGNGAVFFASDTDKMTPVKQYSIEELAAVSQPSSKNLELSFSSLPEPLLFHCGSSDTAKAIIAKLETSKAAAGEALELVEASRTVTSDGEDYDADTPAAEPKAVRWAEPEHAASGATSGAESGKVLYDFDAQGDDELSVKENDMVTVVDKENDEWWLVRGSDGQEGVVPAQYIEIGGTGAATSGAGYDSDDERQKEEDEAAAAASLEAERQREQQRKTEQRRAIERAAREKQQQEDHDRRLAEAIEQEEAEKRARSAAKRDEQVKQQRDHEAERRREAARRMEPPKVSKRPSAQNVAAAAANLPTRGHAAPARPPDNDRPKPNPARTRVWSDKTGQFKVEAEYLGVREKKIRLHKLNGVIIEVPIEKMSEEDVQLVRRHEARKSRAASIQDDDDIPLGRSPRRQGTGSSRSAETIGRASPMPGQSSSRQEPPAAQQKATRRKPPYDWFAFFLDAGVNMDDCTRYAARFERDSLDETLIPDLDGSTLRTLGLKEGDILRVKRVVDTKYAKKTPEQESQIKADEDYARQLQEHEDSGSKGPPPQAPPGLFTGPDGKLANNTRRGRPEKKGSSGPESVDSNSIAGAADALSRATLSPTPPPPVIVSPAPEVKHEKPANLITGFDDDAWTIKPSSSKPASPAPHSPQATGASVNTSPTALSGTDSLLAQIQALRPANTGVASQNTGSSFEQLAQMTGQPRNIQPTQTGSSSGFSGPAPNQYGLGVQGSNMPMGQIQQQSSGGQMANGARGPIAPVASNQALLNPMQPNMTGMFIPTRGSPGGQQQQMQPQQTGFMPPQQTGFMPPQQTGYMQQPMMSQPTGYAQGFQQGYGGPQQMQPNMTGYGGPSGFQQSQNSAFNQVANMQAPQQQPQQTGNGDKFAPSNIFAAMKKSDFGKPEEQQPQNSGKYDALRPLTTGYNGGPGMLQPQQTGYGMMPQMTGYNPQMGYMQGQSPYGQQQQYR